MVIKNTFLSNTDNASVSLRKLLLESCNLHTVLDCPGGTFQGAGVKTVVLFFEKGAPTRKIWYYQLDPGRNLGKTNPLNDDDLTEFVKLQKTFADSPKSWSVDVKSIDKTTFDLSVKNPNGGEEVVTPQPAGDHGRDRSTGCRERGGAGEYQGAAMKAGWQTKRLGEVCDVSDMAARSRLEFQNTMVTSAYLWITTCGDGQTDKPYVDERSKITDLGIRDKFGADDDSAIAFFIVDAPIGHLVINIKHVASNQGCKCLIRQKAA